MDKVTENIPKKGEIVSNPAKWTSREKKHCKISWTEKLNVGTKAEKEIQHSLIPKEWCKLVTKGLPIFKNGLGIIVVHAEYAFKEYMSGGSFEESIEKVKIYADNVRKSYMEQVRKFRLETFIKICEQHYNNNNLEITVEELKLYQFTDLEIDVFTKHLSENGVIDISEIDGKKMYMLKQLDAIDNELDGSQPEMMDDKIIDEVSQPIIVDNESNGSQPEMMDDKMMDEVSQSVVI